MRSSPFHIYYKARLLSGLTNGDDKLIPAFASANIEIYPYQIAAALFALRSPYIDGVILADEGSLGKTFEALLVATQRWYEGKDKQLLVLPANLIRQWAAKIEASFTLPYVFIDSEDAFRAHMGAEGDNPFIQDALVITTYDFAVEKAAYIEKVQWDLTIFDEASCLCKAYTGQNKMAATLKQATQGAFRLLLTPTPITMSIMDIYGLIYFIDETVLPDEESFYNRYFRKPENYPELASWVSKYCFRTLKSQVSGYVGFTNRIPYTISYELMPQEKALYAKLDEYLALPKKAAYPKMDRYELTLMYYHTVSSSAQALCRTLSGTIDRLSSMQVPAMQEAIDSEKKLLCDVRELAESVEGSGKSEVLLAVLKKCFTRLRQIKAEQKVIIFTDNRTTQKHLCDLLEEQGYKGILTYSGNNSRDYSIMERFRGDKNIQILISTDEAAKGLDIEFCPIVVNYDLLYNAVELEQRINRCHRQGQQSDVLVINLLSKDNFSDVRIMELINKRVLQFDGIFGMSDDILGNFDVDIDDVLSLTRHLNEVRQALQENLTDNEPENKRLVEDTQSSIFTSFTKDVADRITVTPQYMEAKIKGVQDELWEIVKWYFADYNQTNDDCHYEIDEQLRTITAQDSENGLPDLFYYWNGSQNKRYRSLQSYGMSPDFRPHYGRVTLASVFGKNMLDQVHCESSGSIMVDADIEPCTIGLYGITIVPQVELKRNRDDCHYYAFAGQTNSGKALSDEECCEIMGLPILEFSETRDSEVYRNSYNSRLLFGRPRDAVHSLDKLIPTEKYIQKRLEERNTAQAEEIENMKRKTALAKTVLERTVDGIKAQSKEAEQELSAASDRISKLAADKKLKLLQSELRRRQDGLFLDGMRLDLQLEEQIKVFIEGEQLMAKLDRQYVIEVEGR